MKQIHHAPPNLEIAAGELARRRSTVSVMTERLEQIFKHGYDQAHDNEHPLINLVLAASCYGGVAFSVLYGNSPLAAQRYYAPVWPWQPESFKPRDTRANLVKAAALLLAAIDRLDATATDAPLVEGEPA